MHFTLTLPDWVADEQARLPEFLPSLDERMDAVIRFSRLNFVRQTGGPFAAGVFERDSVRLVVIGVNRVLAHGVSSAHAEVMALSVAQTLVGTWDLGGPGQPAYQLVVNWRPCAMCYGAALWSGVRSLVVAGHGPELEQITGFDEGPIHPRWDEEFRRRGIEVVSGVRTEQAVAVFHEFAASGALVYNGRRSSLNPGTGQPRLEP